MLSYEKMKKINREDGHEMMWYGWEIKRKKERNEYDDRHEKASVVCVL